MLHTNYQFLGTLNCQTKLEVVADDGLTQIHCQKNNEIIHCTIFGLVIPRKKAKVQVKSRVKLQVFLDFVTRFVP